MDVIAAEHICACSACEVEQYLIQSALEQARRNGDSSLLQPLFDRWFKYWTKVDQVGYNLGSCRKKIWAKDKKPSKRY